MQLFFLMLIGLWGIVGYVFGLHCPWWIEVLTTVGVISFITSWKGCRQFEIYALVIMSRWIAFLVTMVAGDIVWLLHNGGKIKPLIEVIKFLLKP